MYVLFSHLYGENYFLVFCSLLIRYFILSCMSYFCVLEINHLFVVSLETIFSQTTGFFLLCSEFSFAMQKLLSLIRSHLLVFYFIFITLGNGPKKLSSKLCQRMFCMFSNKSFIVSSLTFMFLIHLSLFLCMVLEKF